MGIPQARNRSQPFAKESSCRQAGGYDVALHLCTCVKDVKCQTNMFNRADIQLCMLLYSATFVVHGMEPSVAGANLQEGFPTFRDTCLHASLNISIIPVTAGM